MSINCIWVVRLSYFDMKEYERTGYVWEQYDANTGEGRRRCVNPNIFRNPRLMKSRVLVILLLAGLP
jgi:hypothetical protein